MTAIWKIWSKLTRHLHPPPRAGGKKRFWTSTKHISEKKHDINHRKETCQSTGTLLHILQPWWTLVHKRVFALP